MYKGFNIFSTSLILAAKTPGTVPVVVTTQEGNLLGETTFCYVDRKAEMLRRFATIPSFRSQGLEKLHKYFRGLEQENSQFH